jgi:hypothetical protein
VHEHGVDVREPFEHVADDRRERRGCSSAVNGGQ